MVAFVGWWTEVGRGGSGGAVDIVGGRWAEVGRGPTMASEVVEKSTVECQGGGS